MSWDISHTTVAVMAAITGAVVTLLVAEPGSRDVVVTVATVLMAAAAVVALPFRQRPTRRGDDGD